MKKIVFFCLIIIIISIKITYGQNAKATIGTVTSCPDTDVLVPVNVENFISVGAMTLFIVYDTTQLKFKSLMNIHPSFSGIIYNVITIPRTQIGISYINTSGATVTAGKLFDMKFSFVENSSALYFYEAGCEVAKPNGDIMPVIYVNGGVNPLIKITSQPQNQTVNQPLPASFSVSSDGGVLFQWQISSNGGILFSNLNNSTIYQGVNSGTLSILTTSSFLNGKLYRCVITNGACVKNSDSALLTVLEYNNQIVPLSVGWNSLSSYLNPVNTNLDAIFGPLGNSLVIVISEDKIYYPAGGTNTIGSFDPEKGYSLKINRNQDLTITGSPLQSKSLILPAGWSFLPVIADCNVAISTLFNGIISEVDIIEELPGINVFWPEKGISTLQTLQPGKSYKIKLKNSVTITFPSCNHFVE